MRGIKLITCNFKDFYFLFKYLRLFNFFFLINYNYFSCNIILEVSKKSKKNLLFSKIKGISFKYIRFFIVQFEDIANNTKKNFFIFEKNLIRSSIFFWKYNFTLLNNYLCLLFKNSINFLIVNSNDDYFYKQVYYSLLYPAKDLKEYKWFFNLTLNFFQQSKWRIFVKFLIRRYRINYFLILNKNFIQKKISTILSNWAIKFIIVDFFANKDYFEYSFFFKNLKLMNYMFLIYLFHISSVLLEYKKKENIKFFFEKSLIISKTVKQHNT